MRSSLYSLSVCRSRSAFVVSRRQVKTVSSLAYRSLLRRRNDELGQLHGTTDRNRWALPLNAALFNTKKETEKEHQVSDAKNFDAVGSGEAANEVEFQIVTPESDAWATMQLWKEEILVDSLLSSKFDEMVPKLFMEQNVCIVDDIMEKAGDSNWLSPLLRCGVDTIVLRKKLDLLFAFADTRLVPVDYDISNSKLSHDADLKALLERVDETFAWYVPEKRTFVAPYFPMIQSSGMGKTKLLHELRDVLNKRNDSSCELCLSGKIKTLYGIKDIKDGVYSVELDLHKWVDPYGSDDKDVMRIAAEAVMRELDNCIPQPPDGKDRLVLLFDEAQFLLQKHYGVDAFLFQCVRFWLHEADHKFKCVAVFAGTTSGLSNYYPDRNLVSLLASRDFKRMFLPRGKELPLPFYQTSTIGCYLPIKLAEDSDTGAYTEYDRAVPYGRPLFAVLAAAKDNSNLANRLGIVLGRMLLFKPKSWEKAEDSCLSILATRVQMGQTSTKTASRLVSRGYANLVGFSDSNVAQICYFPDPVCARLAMAMMDQDWSMKVNGFDVVGKPKDWWVEQARDSFSGGLCRPHKGNVGEVFVALYLLFCGDLLRKEIDPSYRHFSVPLDIFVSNLIDPPIQPKEETTELNVASSTTVPTDLSAQHDLSPSVNFIQVCRNYLRPYHDYKYVISQSMLEYLYKSGTAFFAFPDCPDFDIVASIRYSIDDEKYAFAPLLISVKTREFCPSDADSNCRDMERKLRQAGCHRAMGLVIVISSPTESNDKVRTLKTKDVADLFDMKGFGENKVIAKVLRVDVNDKFGISRAIVEATTDGQEMQEIYASHWMVRAHANDSPGLHFGNSLRSAGTRIRKGFAFLETFVKQLLLRNS
jgi:hypothetical protein